MMVAKRIPERVSEELTEAELASYKQVLNTIRNWPSTLQIDLAQSILGFVRDNTLPRERQRHPSGAPRNPMYYIDEVRKRRGFGESLTEEQMRQLVADYQAETGVSLGDEEYQRLLFEVKMAYEPLEDYEPPNRSAFRERSLTRPSTGLPSPSDEEVGRWLDEYRTEKYG